MTIHVQWDNEARTILLVWLQEIWLGRVRSLGEDGVLIITVLAGRYGD
jgi:hypothetical protein